MDAQVFSWDWKAQPPLRAIAAVVTKMSASGQVFMREIDTGSDQYAWVISGAAMTDEQAWHLYRGED